MPWGVTFLPSGNALVGERNSANVYEVSRNGGKSLVGPVAGVVSSGEGGLLGLALSPNFAADRWLYAYITAGSDNRVVRMKYDNGVLGTPRVLLSGIPKADHHNGGRLVFGPGGNLFASTGDSTDKSLPQNKKSLGGKILRMTPTGGVVPGNPFGNYVWSYGHRNVEGVVFDANGRMWASELGENKFDEMNRIEKGVNYGWPRTEGPDGPGGYRDPLAYWRTANCSPSGIAISHGHAYLGALRGESVWQVRLGGPDKGEKVRLFQGQFGRIRTVQNAPDGSLWITTSNVTNDRVLWLTFP